MVSSIEIPSHAATPLYSGQKKIQQRRGQRRVLCERRIPLSERLLVTIRLLRSYRAAIT